MKAIKSIIEIVLGMGAGANFIVATQSELWTINVLLGVALFYVAVRLSETKKLSPKARVKQ